MFAALTRHIDGAVKLNPAPTIWGCDKDLFNRGLRSARRRAETIGVHRHVAPTEHFHAL